MAWELDPMSQHLGMYVGRILYFARQYDHAIQQYQKMIELHPDYFMNYVFLSLGLFAARDVHGSHSGNGKS